MATDNKVSGAVARLLWSFLASVDAWRANDRKARALQLLGANRDAGDCYSRPGQQVRDRKATAERCLYFSPLLISHNVLRGLAVVSIWGRAAPFS